MLLSLQTATDPGSDDLTFTWEWGDMTPVTAKTYYSDGTGQDPHLGPDGTFPFTATDEKTHSFAMAGTYAITPHRHGRRWRISDQLVQYLYRLSEFRGRSATRGANRAAIDGHSAARNGLIGTCNAIPARRSALRAARDASLAACESCCAACNGLSNARSEVYGACDGLLDACCGARAACIGVQNACDGIRGACSALRDACCGIHGARCQRMNVSKKRKVAPARGPWSHFRAERRSD